MQKCYFPSECPVDFTCQEPSADLASKLEPHIVEQLECRQEDCSCKPILSAPSYGVRAKCTEDEIAGDRCCADGLKSSPECPQDVAKYNCARVTCNEGVQAENCAVDGCNNCGLTIIDTNGTPIDPALCRVDLTTELETICQTVACPKSAEELGCPERPSCFPDDWQLKCVLDPCACRTIWINEDVRSVSKACENTLRGPPVEPEDCPQEYTCPSVEPEILAQLQATDPELLNDLICVQEPFTCRPVLVTPDVLPPNFRLSCGENHGRDCCEDGKGPQACSSRVEKGTCAVSVCNGERPASCISDGCDGCSVTLLDKNDVPYAAGECSIPFDPEQACPGVSCPDDTFVAPCPPRPDACPGDWQLRCIRDPCACNRHIWVDEDVRFTTPQCTAAISPPCATECPVDFSCGDEKALPGQTCIQEQCTCRPVIMEDPDALINMGLSSMGIGN